MPVYRSLILKLVIFASSRRTLMVQSSYTSALRTRIVRGVVKSRWSPCLMLAVAPALSCRVVSSMFLTSYPCGTRTVMLRVGRSVVPSYLSNAMACTLQSPPSCRSLTLLSLHAVMATSVAKAITIWVIRVFIVTSLLCFVCNFLSMRPPVHGEWAGIRSCWR